MKSNKAKWLVRFVVGLSLFSATVLSWCYLLMYVSKMTLPHAIMHIVAMCIMLVVLVAGGIYALLVLDDIFNLKPQDGGDGE